MLAYLINFNKYRGKQINQNLIENYNQIPKPKALKKKF